MLHSSTNLQSEAREEVNRSQAIARSRIWANQSFVWVFLGYCHCPLKAPSLSPRLSCNVCQELSVPESLANSEAQVAF